VTDSGLNERSNVLSVGISSNKEKKQACLRCTKLVIGQLLVQLAF
jgi:hypothetical protein